MPEATRLNDNCTGHDACPSVPLIEGSPNVIINGRPAGRVGDHYSTHGCVAHPGHQVVFVAGSSKVVINGKPAARIGDAVSLGGAVQDGSGNVIFGG